MLLNELKKLEEKMLQLQSENKSKSVQKLKSDKRIKEPKLSEEQQPVKPDAPP